MSKIKFYRVFQPIKSIKVTQLVFVIILTPVRHKLHLPQLLILVNQLSPPLTRPSRAAASG